MDFVALALFVLIPLYIYFRARKSGVGVVFNFSLYPLFYSFFYLLLPTVFPVDDPLSRVLVVSPDSVDFINSVSLWTVFVFFFWYSISKDIEFQPNQNLRMSRFALSLGYLFLFFSSALMIFVFATHGGELLSSVSDRGAGYSIYEKLFETYKLQLVFVFSLIGAIVVYIDNRKLYCFLPLLLFCFLDTLVGGRGYILGVATVVYLSYLTFNKGAFAKLSIYLFIVVLLMLVSAFVRRHSFGGDIDPMFTLFGEFYATRFTVQIAFDYLNGAGDLLTYFFLVISKLVPQLLVGWLFSDDQLVNYAIVLNEQTGLSYGLAGSMVAESLYYGGVGYSYVAPVIIGGVYFLLNYSRVIGRFPGYVFFMLMAAASYNIFRSSFFMIFVSQIYILVFYFGVVVFPMARARVMIFNGYAGRLLKVHG